MASATSVSTRITIIVEWTGYSTTREHLTQLLQHVRSCRFPYWCSAFSYLALSANTHAIFRSAARMPESLPWNVATHYRRRLNVHSFCRADALRAYIGRDANRWLEGSPSSSTKKRRLDDVESDSAETAKQTIEQMVLEEIAHQLAKKQKTSEDPSKEADVRGQHVSCMVLLLKITCLYFPALCRHVPTAIAKGL